MNKKILLAASCLAIAAIGGAEAKSSCGAGFNGFYVGMNVAYNAQNAKDKATNVASKVGATVSSPSVDATGAANLAQADKLSKAMDAKLKASVDGYTAANAALAPADAASDAHLKNLASTTFIQDWLDVENAADLDAAGAGNNNISLAIITNTKDALAKKIVAFFKDTYNITITSGGTAAAASHAGQADNVLSTGTITLTYDGKTYTVANSGASAAVNNAGGANHMTSVEVTQALLRMFDNTAGTIKTTAFTDILAAAKAKGEGVFGDVAYKTGYSESTTIEFASETVATKANLGKMSIGLNVGYGKSFGMFYVGGGLTGEIFTAGTRVIVAADTAKKTQFAVPTATNGANTLSNVMTYAEAMDPANTKVSLKTKASFGAELKIGLTSGTWLVYLPVAANVTMYQAKFERNMDAVNAFTSNENPVPATMTGKYTTTGLKTNVELTDGVYKISSAPTAADETTTPTETPTADTGIFTKNKTRFGFAFGIGAEVKLSDSVSLDLRYMYSPISKFTVTTPAYKTGNVADMGQNGTSHVITLSSHKFSLGCSYHF